MMILSVYYALISNYTFLQYQNDRVLSWFYQTTDHGYQAGLAHSSSAENLTSPWQELDAGCLRAGPLLLCTKRGGNVRRLLPHLILYTRFYRLDSFTSAFNRYNRDAGNLLLIPAQLPSRITDLSRSEKPRIPEVSGIYLTGRKTGYISTLHSLKDLKKYGINSIVFDIKDVTGIVTYHSSLPIVNKLDLHRQATIGNVPLLLRQARKEGIYTIARISLFHDHLLAKKVPSYAIQSARTGRPWRAGREIWCDPTRKSVQDYMISLAQEVASMGVDEIQFDYIRFPTSGNHSDARYAYDFGRMKREETITAFLARAHKALQDYHVNLSIDIFGVVAWGKEIDIAKTGQRVSSLAPHCEVISPMLYPSHFNDDFDGIAKPGDSPWYFIKEGTKKVVERSGGKCIVRPWLQAFPWRVTNYNPQYILKQVQGTKDGGGYGYLFWNASSRYSTVYRALRVNN